MNKFHAVKKTVDNITFDSMKESRVYEQLKLLLRGKVITKLILQPEFILQQGYVNARGEKVLPIKYRADFSFYDNEEKRFRVIDVKGFKTAVYILKKKMFDNLMKDHGIVLEEIIGRSSMYGNRQI